MTDGFLLDTNVPSELTHKLPELRVRQWVSSQFLESLFLSAITVGELYKGIHLLALSRRRSSIESWLLIDLLPNFTGRILPVNQNIAKRWGVLAANRRVVGQPLEPMDGLIAATALEHNLALVTRNTKDFHGLGLELVNPWEITL